MAKTSQIKLLGQKWVRLRKEQPPYDWTSDVKSWMIDVQGGDLSACKNDFSSFSILAK